MSCRFRSFLSIFRNILFLVIISGSVLFFLFERQYSLNSQVRSNMLDRVDVLKKKQKDLSVLQERVVDNVNETMMNLEKFLEQTEILEQITRRKNLIFFGINEKSNEIPLSQIKNLIQTRLGIFLDEVVDDATRIDNGDIPRPILVKFSTWKAKTKVFYKRKSFPAYITIQEDLTDLQKERMEKLKIFAQRSEELGKQVKWNGKQLFVDGSLVQNV